MAYIFSKDGSGIWNQRAYLNPISKSFGDGGVSIKGNTAIVGNPPFMQTVGGSVYIYTRDGNNIWTEQTQLSASDGVTSIGYSVSIDGDTVIVGARNNLSGNVPCRESAFIFVRDQGNNWMQRDKLVGIDALGECERGNFGKSVAIDQNAVIIGARSHREPDWFSGTKTGAAYIFVKDQSDNWSQHAMLLDPERTTNDFLFGSSVDVNRGTAIVGQTIEYSNSNSPPVFLWGWKI